MTDTTIIPHDPTRVWYDIARKRPDPKKVSRRETLYMFVDGTIVLGFNTRAYPLEYYVDRHGRVQKSDKELGIVPDPAIAWAYV